MYFEIAQWISGLSTAYDSMRANVSLPIKDEDMDMEEYENEDEW